MYKLHFDIELVSQPQHFASSNIAFQSMPLPFRIFVDLRAV